MLGGKGNCDSVPIVELLPTLARVGRRKGSGRAAGFAAAGPVRKDWRVGWLGKTEDWLRRGGRLGGGRERAAYALATIGSVKDVGMVDL
jgi:hypothetical protein